MKPWIQRTVRLLAIIFLMMAADSIASVGTRGGGHPAAAEFASLANRMIAKIDLLSPVIIQSFRIDANRLLESYSRVKLFTVNHALQLDGNSVAAINDPQKMEIYFNENVWSELDEDQKLQLVIHEFLGLTFAEISDLNYSYSSQLLHLIKENSKGDMKVHCRLSSFNHSSPEDFAIIDESMTWVVDRAIASDMIGEFQIHFRLNGPYMRIQLSDLTDSIVIDTNQYVSSTLDFEMSTRAQVTFENKNYDTITLMCEEALSRTPTSK